MYKIYVYTFEFPEFYFQHKRQLYKMIPMLFGKRKIGPNIFGTRLICNWQIGNFLI